MPPRRKAAAAKPTNKTTGKVTKAKASTAKSVDVPEIGTKSTKHKISKVGYIMTLVSNLLVI